MKIVEFYVDDFEVTIDQGTNNIGSLTPNSDIIWTNEVTVTVRTVWAWFDLTHSKSALITNWLNTIWDYDGVTWYGYDLYKSENGTVSNYDNILQAITGSNIWTITKSIDTTWNRKTYIYKIKFGWNISPAQEAWQYTTNSIFNISVNY